MNRRRASVLGVVVGFTIGALIAGVFSAFNLLSMSGLTIASMWGAMVFGALTMAYTISKEDK